VLCLGLYITLTFVVSREWQQQQYEQEHQKWVTQIQEIQKQSNATTSELEHHLEKQHLMKTK
jgi:hypothetical protein